MIEKVKYFSISRDLNHTEQLSIVRFINKNENSKTCEIHEIFYVFNLLKTQLLAKVYLNLLQILLDLGNEHLRFTWSGL